MSCFNWITVVDLELSELSDCVLLITILESVTSHKLSQNSQHCQECRTKPTVDPSTPTSLFCCAGPALCFLPPDQCSGKPFVCTPHDKLTVAHWLCG